MGRSWSIVQGITGRLLWAAVVIYLVTSAVFLTIIRTPDPARIAAEWQAHRAGREADLPDPPPAREQYVDWITSFLSFDWGESMTAARRTADPGAATEPASNLAAVLDAIPVTMAYVLPATIAAFALALAFGYAAAQNPHTVRTRFSATTMYGLFGLPNFFLAAILFHTMQDVNPDWFPRGYDVGSGFAPTNLLWLLLPGFVLMTHLTAGFYRYVRTESSETLKEPFVTLAVSKGATKRRVGRHILRYAALPLTTLFVAELVGVLLVTVFVIEVVFEVPGVGQLAYQAITNREIELVMVMTLVFSIACILANALQDIVAMVLDVRAEQ